MIPAKSGLFARTELRPRRARRPSKSPLAGAKIPTGAPRIVDSAATAARRARADQLRDLIELSIKAARCKCDLLRGRDPGEEISCPRALFEGREEATTISALRARYETMIHALTEYAK